MYLPSFPNLISEIEAIISVKNDLEPGATGSSNLWKSNIIRTTNKTCNEGKHSKHLQFRMVVAQSRLSQINKTN